MAQIPLRPHRRPVSASGVVGAIDSFHPCENSKPHTVSAQELQARIKAARRKKAASQAPPVTAPLNPRQPRQQSQAPVHPRALPDNHHKRLTQNANNSRGLVCIDSVIERLQTEGRPAQPNAHHGRSVQKNYSVPMHDDIIAIDSLSAHRPQPYRTTSSRSSMVARKSPLSTVSLLDEFTDLPGTDSSRSSSQSSSSSYGPSNGSMETVRPDIARAESTNTVKEAKPTKVAMASDPPPHKNRMSWLHFSRRSHTSTA